MFYTDSVITNRRSEDVTANTFGKRLINMCRSTNLTITNGRSTSDDTGCITFFNHSGTSVIDYAIVNSHVQTELLHDFKVGGFNEFSDHAPIYLTLKTTQTHIPANCVCCDNDSSRITTSKVKWNSDQYDVIREHIAMFSDSLDNTFSDLEHNDNSIDICVERFTSALGDIFGSYCVHAVAQRCTCVCHKTQNKNVNKEKNKPWFCKKAQSLHRDYMNALMTFNSHRSSENRTLLTDVRRKYITFIMKQKRIFLRHEGNHIDFLRKHNPKFFFGHFKKNKHRTNTDLKIHDFHAHFSHLANVDTQTISQHTTDSINDMSNVYPDLDVDFTLDEVEYVLKRSKPDKTPGIDNVINEYFKEFHCIFSPMLLRLFNVILNTGYYPKMWAAGMIVPLHKKGDVNDTNNYRGITLLSHISKLFTSLVNNRLLNWSKTNDIISDAQFGFKPGFGTRDAMFALHGIVSNTLSKKKRLFCCFVDYQKAFDSISHDDLWFKSANLGIRGKLCYVIHSIYDNVSSCVQFNGQMSDFFKLSI